MFSRKYPFSSVTVAIERLTTEDFEEDDLSDIPALVEAINIQSTGPSEAARAIRKKLKYGNVHKQLRALTILDAIFQNASDRSQRAIADEMLLERLRICATSESSEQKVRIKCNVLFRSWAAGYKNTRGMESVASLYKQLPRHKAVPQQPKVKPTEDNPFGNDEKEDEEEERPKPTPPWEASSSRLPTIANTEPVKPKKDKKKEEKKRRMKKFNLAAERSNIQTCIAETSMASTNLLNSLRLINRERERVSENPTAVAYFNTCEKLQKRIQRYIYLVEGSSEFLGALLHANDELGTAINSFKHLDSSIDADSDSEDEMAEQQHLYHIMTGKGKDKENDASRDLAGLHIGKSNSPERRPAQPPRPTLASPPPPPPPPAPAPAPAEEEEEDDYEDEDENDPFADRNALQTPKVEKGQLVWKEV